MKVNIEFIDHKDQRYNTVGDWWWNDGTIEVRISHFSASNGYENLVLLHELIEIFVEWGKYRHSTFPELVDAVDDFDKHFKQVDPADEAGFDPRAPYYKGHMIACAAEHMLAMINGVDYNEYARAVERVCKSRKD